MQSLRLACINRQTDRQTDKYFIDLKVKYRVKMFFWNPFYCALFLFFYLCNSFSVKVTMTKGVVKFVSQPKHLSWQLQLVALLFVLPPRGPWKTLDTVQLCEADGTEMAEFRNSSSSSQLKMEMTHLDTANRVTLNNNWPGWCSDATLVTTVRALESVGVQQFSPISYLAGMER